MLSGVCFFHSETGTEGGFWAFQDREFITASGWSYKGLHILEDGDKLTIMSPNNPDLIIWSGTISLIQYPLFSEGIYNLWIHSDQRGVDREIWAMYFINEYPAKLITHHKP